MDRWFCLKAAVIDVDSQKMMASEISAIYFCLLMICMNKWIWHLWRSGFFWLFFLTSTPHKIQFLPCIKKPTWFILYSHTSSQFVLQNRASNSHDRYNNSSKLFFLMTVGGSSFLPSSFWQKRSTFEDRLQRPKLFFYSGITTKFPGKKNKCKFFSL